MAEDAALPGYSVRVSARARRVRLVMSAERGLEVVVPRRFDRREIPALVESRREWIGRAAERAEKRSETLRKRLEVEPPRLPDLIVLAAVAEEWRVEYRAGPEPFATAVAIGCLPGRVVVRERPGRRLLVTGDVGDRDACRQALFRWLRRKGAQTLAPRVEEIAHRHRLQYGRVTIRLQRTRWASCSRRKNLSLNAKLLFLPPILVDYVLLHELCHTAVMDHSPRFWARLEVHDSNYQMHRALLRGAGSMVPTWIDHAEGEPGL